LEPCAGLSADELYERQWAMALLERVMSLLEAEMAATGKKNQFAMLKGFLIGEHEGLTYDDVARELGMTTAAAKMAASRMRGRYRRILREEIAQTVSGPDEVDQEIRELFRTLGG
jgi:RNA polymerase sigma-70 factor (ECF subfamily)